MKNEDLMVLFGLMLEDPALTFPCRGLVFEELLLLAKGSYDLEMRLVENLPLRCALKRTLAKLTSEDAYDQEIVLGITADLIREDLLDYLDVGWNACQCEKPPDEEDEAAMYAFIRDYARDFADAEESMFPFGYTFHFQLRGNPQEFKVTMNVTGIGLTVEIETPLPVVNPLPEESGIHMQTGKLRSSVIMPMDTPPEKWAVTALLERKAREMLKAMKKG